MSAPRTKSFYRYYPVAERDRNWGIFITTAGECQLGPGATYPPAGHPKGCDFRASSGRTLSDFVIIYISSGSGWFKTAKSGEHRIGAGDRSEEHTSELQSHSFISYAVFC